MIESTAASCFILNEVGIVLASLLMSFMILFVWKVAQTLFLESVPF